MTVILDMPEDEYHSHPALSSSGAKLILESPALFDWVINKKNRVEKSAFDLGSAVHAEVLGAGYGVAELEFDSWRTNAAKQAAQEAREAGLIPMLKKDMAEVHAIAQAVLHHPMGRALLERDGNPEASMFATDPVTGVDLRCRFDFLPDDRRVAVDLKTIRKGSARPHKFESAISEYGYDLSWAHYTLTAELAGDPVGDMVFLVVETEPPFHINTFKLDDDFKNIGATKARVARERFARATETGEWPGYPAEILIARPPQYAIYEHIDMTGGSS